MEKKVLRPRVGRWCRVMFTDVGARDGVCVSRDNNNSFRFLAPFEDDFSHVEDTQVIALGKMLNVEGNGL